MNVIQWYFAFHEPETVRNCLFGGGSWQLIFGHVQAFGYTEDNIWVFFDPQGEKSFIWCEYKADVVNDLISSRLASSSAIYRIAPNTDRVRLPALRPHLHCVTQCAGLMGWRAYTPAGFRRMLLQNGAEVIHEKSRCEQRRGQAAETPGGEGAQPGR